MAEQKNESNSWEGFSDKTTLHGFRFLFEKGSRPRRFLWLFLLIGAIVWVAIEVYGSLQKYRRHPVSTVVKEEYHDSLPFPSVSICIESPVLLSKLRKNKHLRNLAKKLGYTSPENWEAKEFVGLLNAASRQGHYRKVMLNSTQPLKWFLRSATFDNVEIDESNFTREMQGTKGFCYTFNDDIKNAMGRNASGIQNLKLQIKIPRGKNLLPTISRGNSIWILLKQPGECPHSNTALHVPAGFAAYVSIKRREVKLLPPPFPRSHCTNSKKLRLYHRYTVQGCFKECWENMTLKTCNCSNTLLERGLAEECNTSDVCVNKTELALCRGHCIDSCNSVVYNTRISYKHFIGEIDSNPKWLRAYNRRDLKKYSDRKKNYNFLKDHMVNVEVYFEDFFVTEVIQVESYDMPSFMADIGGQLGLFIGASVITWFEFLDFFLLWLWSRFEQQKRQQDSEHKEKTTHFNSTGKSPRKIFKILQKTLEAFTYKGSDNLPCP